MNNDKIQLGEKIRSLRKYQKLSRTILCDTEKELTVRQLCRIENGESFPSLATLLFIAKRLNTTIPDLINERSITIPYDYVLLKEQLFRSAIYGDKRRINKVNKLFEVILEDYYDNLPEVEKLTIDIFKASISGYVTQTINSDHIILAKYFPQIQNKKNFNINDLLLLELFFESNSSTDYDVDLIKELLMVSLKAMDDRSHFELHILNRLLISGMALLIEKKYYNDIYTFLDASKQIMVTSQDFQKKPIVEMIEGKHILFVLEDAVEAKKKYDSAITCAKLFDDTVLVTNIEKEWMKDSKEYLA